MIAELENEILMARKRIYSLSGSTPLQQIESKGSSLFVKREDLSPIHAYKWRGAFNRMSVLNQKELKNGVVTASAGNHAQGVALSAAKLGTHAKIFMPLSTPVMKQNSVRRIGGDHVEVILTGDTYDAASFAANKYAEKGYTFIHPYDHILTIGGQGTIADEIVMSGEGPFDAAFLQIGGGGMASGVACWLRKYYPNIQIFGVEGIQQAGMTAAFKNGGPITLDYVDVFCDGTAVKRVGDLTYKYCNEFIDEMVSVDNREVCSGIQFLWENLRCIPEPAGALGVAAALKLKDRLHGKKVITIVCGANMDFGQLGVLSKGILGRQYYRLKIKEGIGTLSELLSNFFGSVNITEFQFGKKDLDVAWPVIGVDGNNQEIESLELSLRSASIEYENVTGSEDVDFGIIPFHSKLIKVPYFIKLEFYERSGALIEFLNEILNISANICYFKYSFTGERVGRALIGFDFDSESKKLEFEKALRSHNSGYRSFVEVKESFYNRIS